MQGMKRRDFLQRTLTSGVALGMLPAIAGQHNFPVERITDGKSFHWFGYYDKFQIDPTGRYALGCKPSFEHRSPTADDSLSIGIIDLQDNHRWIQIGTSKEWGWQQGCMLQWIPGSNQVIWNDREHQNYVSRVYNMADGEIRTLPAPVYALAPNGEFAIGTEFNRIQNLRPGYGYAGIEDPYKEEKAPREIGLYKLDLTTGEVKLLLSISQLANIPHQRQSVLDNWHWFNHLLVNPDSSRLLFLHRWRSRIEARQTMATSNFMTRMITADTDGDDLYIVDPSGNSSHFVWRDREHILAWTKPVGENAAFWLLRDKTEEKTIVGEGVMTVNGHNTYVPNTNNEWVLNDTYPDKDRMQTLYLYHIPTNRKIILGKFFSPPEYRGEWRCDLHPRCDQQGTRVFFDSTHEKLGRQMYCINIESIVRQ